MRQELKYLVPLTHLDALRSAVAPFTYLDAYGTGFEGRGYTVRSIYLDTPDLRYYHEKKAGVKSRHKLRIRGYNTLQPDTRVFLEIKRKDNAAVAKTRALIAYEAVDTLLRTGHIEACLPPDRRTPQAVAAARSFLYYVYGYHLRPTDLAVYEREAFVGRFDPTLRITFDRNLRGRAYPALDALFDETGLHLVHPGYFVLEVKYNLRFPAWLRPVLARFALRRQSVSKYCLCLEVGRRQWDAPAVVLSRAHALSFTPPAPTADAHPPILQARPVPAGLP